MHDAALLPLLTVWVLWMFSVSGQLLATLFLASVALAAAAFLSGRPGRSP